MSRELSTLAAAYALDALPSVERVEFESRLPDYPELEREVEELQSAAALLAAPASAEAPARVRSAVLARISETRQLPPRVGVPFEPALQHPSGAPTATVTELGAHRTRRAARVSGGRRTFLVAAVAAVAAVGVVLGVEQVRPSTSSPIAGVLAQPDARVAQSSVGAGSAILVWSETEKRVVVQVNSLPDAPTGRTYQLWLIRASGAVSEGTFSPTSGSATLPADGLRTGDAVGITVEPAGGSRQPTTPPILKVALT